MIDILVPCLGRPESISRLKQNKETTTMKAAELIFIISPNDSAVASECISENVRFLIMERRASRHDYSRKMNFAYRETKRPWLLLGAQDIEFQPGWDIAALNCAVASGKRVIGTNDLGNPMSYKKGISSTHPLIARSYVQEHGTIDEPDMIVTEAYDHNWVDRELSETAIYRDEWQFCSASVVKHLHPHWGYGQMDDTHRKGMRSYGRDREIFQRRRPLWGQPSMLRSRVR